MIREGCSVKWKWGGGYAEGIVSKTFTREISQTINGNSVTRGGEEGFIFEKAPKIKKPHHK